MNAPSSRKRCSLPMHADFIAKERNIPVTGTMLKEEALQVANRLGNATYLMDD